MLLLYVYTYIIIVCVHSYISYVYYHYNEIFSSAKYDIQHDYEHFNTLATYINSEQQVYGKTCYICKMYS